MKYFILFLFFCFLQPAFTQGTKNFSINSIILDSLNNKIIPFVSVYKTRDHKGTISDFDGRFTLNNLFQGDTIVCYYIGYERTVFTVNESSNYDTIYIHRKTQLIDEMIVLADDEILYRLVSGSRKTNSSEPITAKTYFEMETFHNNTQLELFQGYYNGIYKGYDVAKLEMKNARFALAPISKRIFASTETSKVMYMQKLMTSNTYFPKSPLEMSKHKLRKSYDLYLASKYKDKDSQTIYVINFIPKIDTKSAFQGTVWIDSLSNNLFKVNFKISDASNYPFESIWATHSLEKVNMNITKSFTKKKGEMFLKSVNFDYTLTYKSDTDSNFNISSRAVLYAYNYREKFTLPLFDFAETSNADYRRIQMLPYNNTFWECTDEFKVENKSLERKKFITERAIINAYTLFSSDTLLNNNLFESSYRTWGKTRISFRKEIDKTNTPISKNYDNNFFRYHLEVQLFMDVTQVCDTIQIITKTILDPYKSYFYKTLGNRSKAFVNIYFDLMEIERRKLETELLKCKGDPTLIKLKYIAAKISADSMGERYFKEVERGTNKVNMTKWNLIVKRGLAIDNLAYFGID